MIGQYPGDRSGSRFVIPDTVVSGSPTKTGNSFFDVFSYDEGIEDTTLHMAAGDAIDLRIMGDWSYTIPTGLVRGLWQIRHDSGGTLSVETGYDFGFAWPGHTSTWTGVPLTAIGGGSSYYAMPSDQLNEAALIDNGYPLVRITCTSGTVDITWVGIRIEQPQGLFFLQYSEPFVPAFEWSGVLSADTRIIRHETGEATWETYDSGGTEFWAIDDTEPLVIDEAGQHITGHGHVEAATDLAAGPQDAVNEAVDNKAWTAGDDVFEAGYGGNLDGGPNVLAPFYIWDADAWDGVWWSTAPTKGSVPAIPPNYPQQSYIADGWEWMDEETDFVGWDVLPDAVPEEPVTWALRQTQAHVESGDQQGSFGVSWGTSATSGPLPLGGGTIANTGADMETGDTELPMSGFFIPDDDGDRLFGIMIFVSSASPPLLSQVASLDAVDVSDGTTALARDYAEARFRVPAWRYKKPIFDPAPDITFLGLKVRLPDNTWRNVGNPNEGPGGRMKIQTPDLTWWQEYRTGDGDVPTDPLRLYTADGWLVVGMFTPD